MRSILTYVFLVGIPLAGLMGILNLGERLVAPRSLAGNWVAVERTSRAAWDPRCRVAAEPDEDDEGPSAMRIVQSGGRADVFWSGVRAKKFRVSLRGDSLEGKLALESGHGCPGGVLRLRAVVSQVNGRDRITGELLPDDCPTCKLIPIDWRRRR
jgi:hypothetical protein